MARNLIAELQAQDPQVQAQPRADAAQIAAEGIGPLQAGAIAAGRGMVKIGRALGLGSDVMPEFMQDIFAPESPTEQAALQALEERQPIATIAGQALGEAAPFLAVPTLGATTLPRVASAVGTGALEGALIARGGGQDVQRQVEAGGIGGATAGTIEAGLPVLGRLGSKIFRRVTGRAPRGALITPEGAPTPELSGALEQVGLDFNDLNDAAQEIMTQAPAGADPAQVSRQAFLEGQGVVPTRAQITRSASDFQAQQEAAKTSGRVRRALEGQEAALTGRFENAIEAIPGDPVSPVAPAVEAIKQRSTRLSEAINDLYAAARQQAGDDRSVDMSGAVSAVLRMRPSNRIMKGVPSAIRGQMLDLGIIDRRGEVLRKATPQEAEQLRQFTNSLFNPASPQGNMGIKQIKDTIDNAVGESVGGDVFQEARAAKAQFERDLSRVKVDRFDRRRTSIVRDTLDGTIDPDDYFNKVIIGKKYRAEELGQLKRYLTRTGTEADRVAGEQAWNDLRAETLEWIKETAFQGPEDGQGFRAITRASLDKALKRIGMPKMRQLFSPQELQFISDMRKVTRLREPVRETAKGLGPSAQAVRSLEQRLAQLPIMGALVNFVDFDAQGRAVLKARPAITGARPQLLPTAARAAGVAGAVGMQMGDDNATNN